MDFKIVIKFENILIMIISFLLIGALIFNVEFNDIFVYRLIAILGLIELTFITYLLGRK